MMKEFGYSENSINMTVSKKPFPAETLEVRAIKKDGSEISLGRRPVYITPADVRAHFNMRTKTGGKR